jgi:hypothetical protein
MRISAYSSAGEWALLSRLASEKRNNPVGFRPFALAAIRHGQPESETGRYIDRIASAEERLELAMDQVCDVPMTPSCTRVPVYLSTCVLV